VGKYKLTGRGRILLAVLLVFVILLSLSAVLTALAFSNNTSPPPVSNDSDLSGVPGPADTPALGDSAKNPPPSGNGSDSSDDKQQAGDKGTEDQAVVPAPEPPLVDAPDPPPDPAPDDILGPTAGSEPVTPVAPGANPETTPDPVPDPVMGLDRVSASAGTLTFYYAPDFQSELDAETLAAFKTFLSSPKNTRSNVIVIEMPYLTGDTLNNLIAAVANAFETFGIRKNDLSFIMFQGTGLVDGSGLVKLYYTALSGK